MNSKPEDLVAGLSACDTDSKLKALRGVKNQIIGNKNKKLAFIKLGAVPLVVDILREHTNDSNLLVQSAAAVGSFAYGFDPGAKAVLESDAVPQLMSTLSCQDEKVVEAGTRALKIVYQSPDAPRAKLFTDEAISRLVELLSKPGCAVAEVAASVLARCCQTTQQAQLLLQHDVLEGLLPLLSHPRPSAREAAADALAVLAERSSDVCRSIAANATALEELLLMLKATSPHLRLLAGTTLTFVSCCIRTPPSPSRSTSSGAAAAAPAAPASSVPHAGSGASTSASAASTPDQQRAGEIQKVVLPVLVKLLDAPELQEQLPQVLAYLIASSAEPQKCVSDVSAVRKLTSLLKRSEASTPSSLAGTLECLGTLCMDSQQNRAALSESHSIAAVARALHSPCNRVRASAARCLRALNRSVNLPLFDNETVSCLLRLLQDDDEEVQLASCQALCNMVLDVNNSCRECILRMQGIRAFVAHTTSAHSPLRHAATNALANVAYTATTEVKTMLMEALSWERLRLLLRDAEPEVATKALLLLQNLANITEKQQADLDLLLQWAPLHELMPQLEHHLQLPAAHGLKAVEKAVLTVNNLVVGCQALRESLCSGAVPELLLPLLRLQEPSDPDQAAKVRTAAVWIIINLIFIREGKVTAMVQERVAMLRGKGLEEQLRGMRSDSHTIVRERIKQALDAIDKIARAQTSDS